MDMIYFLPLHYAVASFPSAKNLDLKLFSGPQAYYTTFIVYTARHNEGRSLSYHDLLENIGRPWIDCTDLNFAIGRDSPDCWQH